jgi:hypothetical protein
MKRVHVELLYRLRCADSANAYRNLSRAIWRLQGSIRVDLGLLPAPVSAEPVDGHDFELHCLIQQTQRSGGQHWQMQALMDAIVQGAAAVSSREHVRHLASLIGLDVTVAPPGMAAESGVAVRRALARVSQIDPIQIPAFLFDDEHLLHGNASPAFIHDVLQTLAAPRTTVSRKLLTSLSRWMS